jgi:pyridoxine 4-dehydrogenase
VAAGHLAPGLTAGVHDNLRNLGLDALDIVNYRAMGSGHGPAEGSIAEQVTVLADLRARG